jgi:8-oxo-dGTP pyrophosphatase MutT (NUDIX family)
MSDLILDARLREMLRGVFSTRTRDEIPKSRGTAAAVLVPMFIDDASGEVRIWLLRRPETMRSHGGQIAFPGGKSEATDASLLETALRETDEEVAIAPTSIDVLGALDDFVTITGFVITPYVGWLIEPVTPKMNPSEVARVFSAPLRAFFTEPSGDFPLIGWSVENEFVWGATARIAASLAEIVRDISSAT